MHPPDLPVRVRPEVAAAPRYVPGRRPGAPVARVARLASNEAPHPPLPSVQEALARSGAALNRYPDPTAAPLREAIGAFLGVAAAQVVAGPGSVALCRLLLETVAGDGDEVLFAWRSFEAYPQLTRLTGARAVAVPLTAAGEHDLPAMAAAVSPATRLVFLCSPNNPTGPVLGAAGVQQFLAALPTDCLVVYDEAYGEYVDPAAQAPNALGLVAAHPNVVLLRTFSKAYGLAGARLGYLVGHPALAGLLRGSQVPFAVSQPAIDAGLASLLPVAQAELIARVAGVVARRRELVGWLAEHGMKVPDSQGNFLWLPVGERTVAMAQALEDGGVFTRPFAAEGIRVTIGDESELALFREVLAPLLGG